MSSIVVNKVGKRIQWIRMDVRCGRWNDRWWSKDQGDAFKNGHHVERDLQARHFSVFLRKKNISERNRAICPHEFDSRGLVHVFLTVYGYNES